MSRNSFDRRMPWRPGITAYFSFMSLVLLCILFPAISIFFFYQVASFRDNQLARTIHLMQENLKHYGIATTRSLTSGAEEAIAGYDYTFLNDLLRAEVRNNPELVYSMVINDKTVIIAHNQIDNVGTKIDDGLSWRVWQILKNEFVHRENISAVSWGNTFETIKGTVQIDGKSVSVLEVLMPVHNGKELFGALRCGFSMKGLESEIEKTHMEWDNKMRQFRKMFISISGAFFFVGLVVTSLFSRFFIKSTMILSNSAGLVTEGNLDHEIARDKMFCREFVNFAEVFNNMTRRLKQSLKELDQYSRFLEQMVNERTKDLKDAQEELLRQAHEAGMAEMAVGVLHNIGNAITPAKVDASMLLRRFRDSVLSANLPKVFDEIHDALDMRDQLSTKEKERLQNIIRLLPHAINEDYERAVVELNKICAKHEHIEGIISLQMRYARLIGENEKIDLNLIVEDALKMLETSLKRRAVEVDVKLNKIPNVKIEKAKMIQVVINLLKNGYEAMDSPDLAERRLSVETFFEPEPEPQVVLVVNDTGIGFGSEKKDLMFKFGYTTKPTGSGFGLHSCANFLIAHNGSLHAYSKGEGMGSRFEVRLPALVENA